MGFTSKENKTVLILFTFSLKINISDFNLMLHNNTHPIVL